MICQYDYTFGRLASVVHDDDCFDGDITTYSTFWVYVAAKVSINLTSRLCNLQDQPRHVDRTLVSFSRMITWLEHVMARCVEEW
jgi:hypothetical protein